MRYAYFVYGYVEEQFNLAWLKHQKRGKHHSQWWILPEDSGQLKVLPMPDKYRREMLADWTAVGKAFGEENALRDWYIANRNRMELQEETRGWIEA